MEQKIVLSQENTKSNSSEQYSNITLSEDNHIEKNNQTIQVVHQVTDKSNKTNISIIKTYNFGCLAVTLGLIFAIGLVGLTITYIVYVIISLCQTSYKEQKDMCEKSNAWLYLLLSLIIGTIGNSSGVKLSKSESESKSSGPNLIQSMCVLVFTIWGCVELFGIGCVHELKSTLLYTMLEISVIAYLVIGGIIMVFGLLVCGCTCFLSGNS